MGKVDLFHAPAILELLELELLAPPALTPRFLEGGGPVDGELPERLAFVCSGISPLDLLDGGPR